MCRWAEQCIKGICSSVSRALLERFHGPRSDNLLNLMQEELRRAGGSRWTTIVPKMSQDVLMLLIPTPSVTLRMGLEHSIPISHVSLVLLIVSSCKACRMT